MQVNESFSSCMVLRMKDSQSLSCVTILFKNYSNQNLPPTSASAALHTFRTYYQVQDWLVNKLDPEEWVWIRRDGILQPIKNT